MEKSHLHTLLSTVEPRPGLYEVVLQSIVMAERRAARVYLGVFSFIALLSGVALVPITQYFVEQFSASGFGSYASLMFSDSSLMLTYWHEFALTLFESLPSLALLLFLPFAAALIWSLLRVNTYARRLSFR